MINNLGKTLIIFFSTVTLALAQFTTSISPKHVNRGDDVALSLNSDVSDAFPVITDINGVEILRQSNGSSTSYINGVRSGSYTRTLIFTALKDMTIPSYTMIENGKEVHSKPIPIKVNKVQNNNANGKLFFKAYLSKKEVLVGEPFIVTLVYKQAKDLEVVDRRLMGPKGKHFWVQKKPIETPNETASYLGTKIQYVFTAQKEGTLTIDPAQIKVGEAAYKRDFWGNIRGSTRYKTLFSDELKIKVKPLPAGVENVGDFTLDVAVDKTLSDEKDAINVTITLKGEGNIEDIPKFVLPLDSVLIYDEKPHREHAYSNGKYQGTFTQKFALVSDHNYTIPALKFSFYSLKKKKTITLSSHPIEITIKPTATASKDVSVKVEKAQKQSEPEDTKVKESYTSSWLEIVIALVIGVFIGLISKSFSLNKVKKVKVIKLNLKGEKALLHALMPFADSDAEAKEFVEILSANIYDKKELSYDKKVLHKLLKRLGIKN